MREAREWIGDGPSISLAARPSTRGPPPRLRGLRHNERYSLVERAERLSREREPGRKSLKNHRATKTRFGPPARTAIPPLTGVGRPRGAYRLPPVRAPASAPSNRESSIVGARRQAPRSCSRVTHRGITHGRLTVPTTRTRVGTLRQRVEYLPRASRDSVCMSCRAASVVRACRDSRANESGTRRTPTRGTRRREARSGKMRSLGGAGALARARTDHRTTREAVVA